MGEDATDVSEKEALNFVLEWVSVLLVQLPGPGTGLRYTVTNDVSVRKLQLANAQWCFGKGYDETCPIGPAIIRRGEIDPDNLQLRGELSGELVRESNTNDMIFSCRKAISFLSQGKTLEKGSIILMGTLSGIGWMRNPKRTIKDGEEMKIWFEVMDTLINQFKYI